MSNRLDQEREERLQPTRLQSCKEKLESMGFIISSDDVKMKFEYKGGNVLFYPYSGWHTGRTIKDGRGFGHLLEQLTEPNHE